MKEILERITRLAGGGRTGALASILTARGSLPMSRRSKMLVLPDGSQLGTVGGGCLEAEVHALGRVVIRSGSASFRRFTLTESKAGSEGLNCGGTVEMLVEPVGSGSDGINTAIYGKALSSLARGEESVLATALRIPEDGPDPAREPCPVTVLGKGLVSWKGLKESTGVLSDPDAASLTAYAVEEALAILGQDRAALAALPDQHDAGPARLFLESVTVPPTLYLCGGGHVSLCVASVARTAGFRVIVIDDRPAFANPDRFPDAEATLVRPMATALEDLPIDRNAYIVAVTRGHQHDEPIIEQAIRTPARYIGMIGSRRKVALMWKRLKERGATEEDLSRVHAPIGLSIGADSPGEIAISIVAEMVRVRRGTSA